MSYPNKAGKHDRPAMFSPSEFVAYMRQNGHSPLSHAPKGVILCYSRRLMDYIRGTHRTTIWEHFEPDLYLLENHDRQIGVVGQYGIGAPAAVTAVEELIALGVREFISVGTAGSLQKHVHVGDIVVCSQAIRDEGTSYHYLPSGKYADAGSGITTRIQDALRGAGLAFHVGVSWTIDAPYRETIDEVIQYQAEGVLAVEMEAAALFAVGTFRGIQMGSILTISDSLADLRWRPEFHSDITRNGIETIYSAAVDVLAASSSCASGQGQRS